MSAGLALTSGAVIGRPVVACWTGRQVRALRVAARLEMASFAESIATGEEAINSWENAPAGEVPINAQARLDAFYEAVDAATVERFRHLATESGSDVVSAWREVGAGSTNQTLHGLMLAAGLSRAELADQVRMESAARSRPCGVDRTRVDRWLAGWPASSTVAGHVAAVLSLRLGRLVTVGETGLVRRYPNRIRQLRQAKPRPWTQDRLIVAIEQAARDLGRPLPTSRRSLKTMVSRWENGHHRITPENRRLLCQALACRDSDLDVPPAFPGIALVPDPNGRHLAAP